jgi:hypothetical protein
VPKMAQALQGIELYHAQHDPKGRLNKCDGCEQSCKRQLPLLEVRSVHIATLPSPRNMCHHSRESSHAPHR